MTEPVLYRHFPSKRALYLACMDWSWEEVKALWAERLAAEPDPGLWLSAIGRAFVESEAERPRSSPLWVQALAESSVDPEIAAYMRAHMHEVHEYVADVIRRAQEAGRGSVGARSGRRSVDLHRPRALTMADEVVGALLQDAGPPIREQDRLATGPASPTRDAVPVRGIDEAAPRADASTMFCVLPGDNPEAPALRPSRCLRVGVAGNLARLPHPSAWRPAGMRGSRTIAKLNEKSSSLVK